MTHYGSWEGADLAWEYIHEAYTDIRYRIYGPFSAFGFDYWHELPDDEKEREIEEWKKSFIGEFGVEPVMRSGALIDEDGTIERMPDHIQNEYRYLAGEMGGLSNARKLCKKAADTCRTRVSKQIGRKV